MYTFYTSNLLLALAICHPQKCSATLKSRVDCTCGELPPMLQEHDASSIQ